MSEVRSLFHWNNDGTFTIERRQDVEDVIERNKALQTTPQDRRSEFRHIASIPNVILERWMNESGVNLMRLPADEFARFVRKKLADPDFAFLRTG